MLKSLLWQIYHFSEVSVFWRELTHDQVLFNILQQTWQLSSRVLCCIQLSATTEALWENILRKTAVRGKICLMIFLLVSLVSKQVLTLLFILASLHRMGLIRFQVLLNNIFWTAGLFPISYWKSPKSLHLHASKIRSFIEKQNVKTDQDLMYALGSSPEPSHFININN